MSNPPNADGQTALMILARTSNVEAAELLMAHGANVNAHEQWRDQTALMWAAAEKQPAMVRLLLKHGAAVDARSLVNDFTRQVTAEPRMQARPSGGFTPLLYAARAGCLECAQLLIKAGADPNLGDPDGVSPLLESILNFHFDVAALLIKHGVDVDHWDTWGRSPLYAAVDLDTLPVGGRADRPSLDQTSSLQVIRMLLVAGANPNLQLKLFPPYRSLRDDRGADSILSVGATPLLRAAKAGDLPAIQLLLAHGANVELPTATGISPLLAAAGVGSSALDTRGRYKTQSEAIGAVQALLDAGADVNEADHSGQTALHGAASWGWNDLVKTLAERHANLMAKDARGRTAADVALGSASSSGRASAEAHPETAALLRQLMADGAQPIATQPPSHTILTPSSRARCHQAGPGIGDEQGRVAPLGVELTGGRGGQHVRHAHALGQQLRQAQPSGSRACRVRPPGQLRICTGPVPGTMRVFASARPISVLVASTMPPIQPLVE